MTAEILKQGAEGRLFLGKYKDEPCLVKERFVKKYRNPELDTQITRQRMKAETKAAGRCQSAGILCPRVLHMDLNERRIYMEYFEAAITTKEYIQRCVAEHSTQEAQALLETMCGRIGAIIGRMHAANIIHGDLTTSNILINPVSSADDKKFAQYDVIMIDFGLSHYNQGVEDKSVDLYVLERALLSTHSEQSYLFDKILAVYREHCGQDRNSILTKFDEVRARGRKRTMIG